MASFFNRDNMPMLMGVIPFTAVSRRQKSTVLNHRSRGLGAKTVNQQSGQKRPVSVVNQQSGQKNEATKCSKRHVSVVNATL